MKGTEVTALAPYQKCHCVPVRIFFRTRVIRKVDIWMGSIIAKLPSRTPCPELLPC